MKSRAHILVVDDERVVRDVLQNILLHEGYSRVVRASDGQVAMDKLAKERFDVVITDVKMPMMSGIELLIKIKELYPHIAVIVITGFGDVHTPEEAQSLGADEYVTKPIQAREIAVIVERVRMRQMVTRGDTKSE